MHEVIPTNDSRQNPLELPHSNVVCRTLLSSGSSFIQKTQGMESRAGTCSWLHDRHEAL